MKSFQQFKLLCEYLEGCSETPPPGFEWLKAGWARGIWWGLLAGLIILFCGQTSKFIYIDF
jgi:hypothetical protein